ncbi:ead/Ea22-like family protein [Escherichia coli]|nr:ead/Ea22-like family protein [Escherichia coli]EFI4059395.1 ead/Ea22-like family protein [Escherichia coli]
MSKIDYQVLREAAVAIETVATPQKLLAFRMKVTPQVVLALLDELEAKDKAWSAQDNHINQQAYRIESLEKKNGELGRSLEAAEKRIAELEAESVSQTCKLNEPSGNSPVTPDGWVIVPKELTPEMMRAVQIRSELGGYATSNLSGAYIMFSEFWNVAVSAAPKVDDL